VLSVKIEVLRSSWGLWSLCAVASFGSSVEGHLVDALALRGDEGRGTLRKAAGRGEHPLIRGSPNGETRPYWVIAC
jgi:hypothetical protein